MGKVATENRLKRICRKCEYRRKAKSDDYYHGTSRLDSRCAFLNLTGECRGCTPTDGHCDRYKQRVNKGSLKGRTEVIK